MSIRPPLFSLVIAALVFTSPLQGADPISDSKDDPLPKGAKLRIGNDRLIFRFGPVFSLAPPDYNTILMPEATGGVRRFDVLSGRPLDKPGAEGFVGGQVVVSGDGKRAVHNRAGVVFVTDVATGNLIRELRPPDGFRTTFTSNAPSAVLSHDGKILAQGGFRNPARGVVTIWDVDNGTELARLPTIHSDPVCPVISPDGKIVAARAIGQGYVPPDKADSDTSRVIQVMDVASGKDLFKVKVTGAEYQITAVTFSPDGSILATGCSDGLIDLWDVKTGKAKSLILGRTGQGARIAFSPDGKTIAAIASDGAIQRWTVADGRIIGTTEGPADLPVVQGIGFAGNERVVAWGTYGQRIIVWEAPSGKMLSPAFEHSSGIKSITFAGDGKELVTAGLDGQIVRWDTVTGKPIKSMRLRPPHGQATSQRIIVNLSPDATRAISIGPPSSVFDLKTGLEQFALPRGPVFGFSTGTFPSPDLSKAIIVSTPFDQKKNGKCAVWDLNTRQKLIEMELTITSGRAPAVAITPSGSRLVVAGLSRNPMGGQQITSVSGWDLKTGKMLAEIEDMNAAGSLSVAAASESYAVVLSGSGRLRLFDFESGRGGDEIEPSRNRNDVASPIVFSPDGKSFAVGFATEEQGIFGVRVYEWPRCHILRSFSGHLASISALAFTSDGKTLASGAQDTSVLLWDLSALTKPK